jgi:hypothetical protein
MTLIGDGAAGSNRFGQISTCAHEILNRASVICRAIGNTPAARDVRQLDRESDLVLDIAGNDGDFVGH